ncbi:MAG: hypothetical protein D6678_07535 [Zetaproteobacteria bacterium]|nr:MAG: hypothetical protein D6678_07535 [Zetaproteobacteria bacterium]
MSVEEMKDTRRLSPRTLGLLFVAMTVVSFAWHVEPLRALDQAVRHALSRQGVHLIGGTWAWHGIGVQCRDTRIEVERMRRAIALHRVVITPAFASLLHGELALAVAAEGEDGRLSMLASRAANEVRLRKLVLELSADRVSHWLTLPLPVAMEGTFGVRGALSLASSTGRPDAGSLEVEWTNAGVHLAGDEYLLGTFHGHIDRMEHVWRWSLRGGTALRVSGQGEVADSGQLRGRLSVVSSGKLADIIPSGDLVLDGTLDAPRYRWSGR